MTLRALVRHDLRNVARERTLVVAFLVQLVLAAFSTLLVTGLTALYDPEAAGGTGDATVAYVGDGGFAAVMAGAGLDVRRSAAAEALESFHAGRVDAVVEEIAGNTTRVRVIVPDGEVQTTLLVTRLKGLLQEYQDDLRSQRADRLELDLHAVPDAPRSPFTFVHAVLLPVLVITPVFLSGAVAGDALSQESRTRTLVLLRAAPVGPGTLVLGRLIVPVLLVPVQVALWLGLFAWRGHAAADPLGLLAAATAMGVLVCAAGLLVAALVRNESATQATYAVVVLALAVFAMLLPRDPLNTLALLSAGSTDAAAWSSIGLVAAAAVAAVAAATRVAARRLRSDAL